MKQTRITGTLHKISRGSKGRWYLLTVLFILFGSLSLANAGTVQEPQVEYSADQSMETEQFTMKARVYHAPNKERREQDMGGMRQIMITRMDKKVVWILMPDTKMYMENRLTEGKEGTDNLSAYNFEETVVGEEVVNGIRTTKSKLIMTNKKDGSKLGGFHWKTKEGIEVKMDMIAVDKNSKTRFKSELTNLKIGKQDPKLFEIPAGYSKMSIPSGGGLDKFLWK